jgi:hypothetical protein
MSRMGKRIQRHNAGSSALPVPGEMRKVSEALFEQQMWCWGCDVRREAGNLLLAYGMEKQPSPDPRYHSAYHCTLDTSGALTLWGWGIWVAMQDYGSIFISRSHFRVRYSEAAALRPAAWCEKQLPPLSPVSNRNVSTCLLVTAFQWIAEYERWLACRVETDYRDGALAAWPLRRRYGGGVPARDVPDHWTQIAQRIGSTVPN